MKIPDTRLARQATEMVREVSPEFLLNHCLRAYHFGAAVGEKRGVKFDAELLYLATVLHDIGLVPSTEPPIDRFEVDGADRARQFLLDRGLPEDRAATVWEAVALHTSVGIATRRQPEVALTFLGTATDIAGLCLAEMSRDTIDIILAELPRLGMKEQIKGLLLEVIRRNPRAVTLTWMAEYGRAHLPGFQCPTMDYLIAASPFTE
jgi:hypothetical protein